MVIVALLGGCQLLQPAGGGGGNAPAKPGLSPVLQRMQRAYPDLATGRFVSLADLESPGQVNLFRTVGADGSEEGRPQPTLSILRSRNETGAGSLKVILENPDDRVLFDGKRSAQLALIRDWRKYALLLTSIHGPPAGATLEFGVRSGSQTPIEWSRTIDVRPGWNLFRFDVATIGDTVDLADVRALWWRAPQATAASELYFDDIILADNTQYQLGENAQPDELFVFTRGQRIHVGARGRFELAFCEGVVVAWHDQGPENLADIGGLGPWPVPLPENWSDPAAPAIAYDDPHLFAAWGATVATAQRLVEVTPFRIVVEGEWRFVDGRAPPTATASATRPGHTWRYVIYPSGRVHVRVTSLPGSAGWAAARVGYAIGLDGRRDFHRVEAPPAGPNGSPLPFVLLARTGASQADLLWTSPQTTRLTRYRELISADDRRLAIIAGDVEPAGLVDTVHLLRVWPPDLDAAPEGQTFAADYQEPAALTVTAGQLVTDVPGDLNHDGYNEAEGCYELALGDHVLRLDFAPGPRLRFDPVFRVHGTADRQCWVYARGRTVQDLGRDADKNLLFRVAPVISAPTAIEVHTAPADGGR